MSKPNVAHNFEDKIRTKDVILDNNVTFDSFLLSDNILKGLAFNGFKKPSPIQLKSIPLGRCGFDLITKSKSGTGKTLVFSVVALETVNAIEDETQVLILVPAREIATQIEDVLKNIGCFIQGLKVHSFIGGLPLDDDIEKLKTCHIAVGTPGRIKQLINNNFLKTDSIHLFVLDEADKLMESSYQNDINEIYNKLPSRKQMITSSATYTAKLETFLSNYMLSPTHISAENETPLLLGLKQFISVLVSNSNIIQQLKMKNEQLINILSNVSFTQCLVFSNFQTRAESLCHILNQKGWNSTFISAAQSQPKRLQAVNDLKEFKCRILISTDLTSRGIDASNVDLVINYDAPRDAVTYLHRMGRAGRFGSSGICITLALEATELKMMQNLIGVIGGTNLSIAKLPELGVDLWNIDLKTLPQVYGIIEKNSEEIKINIKNEVMKMKEEKKYKENKSRNCNKSKKKKIENKTIAGKEDDISVDNSTSIMAVLDNTKMDFENNCENFASIDPRAVFEALASGTSNYTTEETNKTNNKINEDLSIDIFKQLAADNSKKRIECEEASISTDETEENFDSKTLTFCKNQALLNVTKLLTNPSREIEDDIRNSIDNYQSLEKNGNELLVSTFLKHHQFDSTMEILENSDAFNNFTENLSKEENMSNKTSEENNTNVLENIFKTGYDCAIKRDKKHWLSYFSETEIAKFEKYCTVSSESEEADDEDDFIENLDEDNESYAEYNEDIEMEDSNTNENDVEEDITKKWVPVMNSNELKPESSDKSSDQHFRNCYDECSNSLWQYGLSFENVDDFDNWFYQWQAHVMSIRNYVQQNIYVDEMSKYQQSKEHCNK